MDGFEHTALVMRQVCRRQNKSGASDRSSHLLFLMLSVTQRCITEKKGWGSVSAEADNPPVYTGILLLEATRADHIYVREMVSSVPVHI